MVNKAKKGLKKDKKGDEESPEFQGVEESHSDHQLEMVDLEEKEGELDTERDLITRDEIDTADKDKKEDKDESKKSSKWGRKKK